MAADDEVFEINDFTVVTEGEHFVLRLETQLNEWALSGKRPNLACPSKNVCFLSLNTYRHGRCSTMCQR